MFRVLASLVFIILSTLVADTSSSFGSISHHQLFAYMSKQTDCGTIKINEETEHLPDNFNEDNDIDDANANAKGRTINNFLVDLSSCLTDANNEYSSFSTHFSSKTIQAIFKDYFYLNEKNGTLYQVRAINREQLCLEPSKKESTQQRSKRSLMYSNQLDTDSIQCDCKSIMCELKFKFVAFLDSKPNRSSRNKTPGLLNYQYLHNRYQANHKNLIVTVAIQDLNDNSPVFKRNFNYLSLPEQIGTVPKKKKPDEEGLNFVNIKSEACPLSKEHTNFEQLQNTLVPLERATDKDAGENAKIAYTLLLFRDRSLRFIEELEAETDKTRREKSIRDAVETQTELCNDQFELIETQLNSGEFAFDSANKIYDFATAGLSVPNLQPLLFLKVNTFLDREERDVFNFVLIARDESREAAETHKIEMKTNPYYFIQNDNYLLLRLAITDLNDNSPVFIQNQLNNKYNFHLKEIAEYSTSVSDRKNKNYAHILNKTCTDLRSLVRVEAIDKDLDLNGKVKYKLVQQVHRKNSNYRSNLKQILQLSEDRFLDDVPRAESLFSIDEMDGSIQIQACQSMLGNEEEVFISEKSFFELTALLDYELYNKHILVIEASDSSLYNPLQTFVTVELNLVDVNDHAPYLVDFHTKTCASKAEVDDDVMKMRVMGPVARVMEDMVPNEEVKIVIESFKPRPRINFEGVRPKRMETFISSRIVITGLSEQTKIGTCIGQFLVQDLDTPLENRDIQTILYEDTNHLLIDPNHELNAAVHLSKSNKFVFRNSFKNKDQRRLRQLNNSLLMDTPTEQISSQVIFELFINFEADIEEKKSHEFILMIRDFGEDVSYESYAHFIVELADENDNKPHFAKNFYQFSIYEWFGTENQPYWSSSDSGGTNSNDLKTFCIGQIQAEDKDILHKNSFIFYEISEVEGVRSHHRRGHNARFDHKAIELFYVNQTTGIICVRNHSLYKFDREVKSLYNFRFSAINKLATPEQKTSVLVEVVLKDLNDNRPEFSLSEYTFFIPEKDSNVVNSLLYPNGRKQRPIGIIQVGRVIALDKDSGINAQLKYFLQPKDEVLGYKSYFELNTKNPKNPYLDGKEITLAEVEHNYQQQRSVTSDPTLNKRLFKIIDDIHHVVSINENTGQVYLLRQFDREEITHIRFRVFVSDRLGNVKLGDEAVLSNSVPVVIELIDTNDNKPMCDNAELKYEHENMIRTGPQFIYSVYMNLTAVQGGGSSNLVTSFPIYQLECSDVDLGKNAELTYEIEKVYLKPVEYKAFDEFVQLNSFSLSSYVESLSPSQRKILGPVDQTQDLDTTKRTNFLKNTQLFSIEHKSGLIYYNHHMRDLWHLNSLFHQTSFFNNNFLIVRVKVKDNGFSMVDSSNSFTLKLRFCFRDQDKISDNSIKYCDFHYFDEESRRIGDGQKILMQRLENVEEELKVYDYTLTEPQDPNASYEYQDYIPESGEDMYDSDIVGIDKTGDYAKKYTVSQPTGQQMRNKTRINNTLIGNLFGYAASSAHSSYHFVCLNRVYVLVLVLFNFFLSFC